MSYKKITNFSKLRSMLIVMRISDKDCTDKNSKGLFVNLKNKFAKRLFSYEG